MKLLKFQFLSLAIGMMGFFVFVSPTHAQNYAPIQGAWDQLGHAAGARGAGYGEAVDPRLIVANIVKLALGLVATIIFVLMIFAGYKWMTAGGNEDQIADAKRMIFNSTIGLIIILAAYGITILITNLALGRTLSSGAQTGSSLEEGTKSTICTNAPWFCH